jgi:acyl-CoA synthetase (NDP forming)
MSMDPAGIAQLPTQDHESVQSLLRPILHPRRAVILGASRRGNTISARPARYLREWGFDGEVVVVNPSSAGAHLEGFPVVANLEAAGPADVALVLVRARNVVESLQACADNGIMRAIVIASGFEGASGAAQRAELESMLAANPGLRIVGPNCTGVLSTASNAPLCFSSVLLTDRPRPGKVGLITQSGAIGNALLLGLVRRGVGLSHWISTGDELSIHAVEAAAALLNEPDCQVVGLFLEGITDAHNLPLLAAGIERTGKRVVALRVASSPAAAAAAFGHTGRTVGSTELARASLRNAGVELVDTLDELLSVLAVLGVLAPTGPTGPKRVGIVTVSGGWGVMAVDAISTSAGLDLAKLDGLTRDLLQQIVPATADAVYPLDVPTLGDSSVFQNAIETSARSPGTDALVCVISTLAHDYDALANTLAVGQTPTVLAHLSPEERFSPSQASTLAQRGIAVAPNALAAVRALDIWAGRPFEPTPADRPSGDVPADSHPMVPGRQLGLIRSVELLGDSLGRVLARTVAVGSAVEAVAAATEMGWPVAIKSEGSVIAHRSEIGAVEIGLSSEAETQQAFERVRERSGADEIVVQAMAGHGIELMVSCIRDRESGVVVVCRTGGLLVELTGLSAILTGPPEWWPEQLSRSPLHQLLAGWRGAPQADVAALIEFATGLRQELDNHPEIAVIECNPVLVHRSGHGITVVDVLTYVGASG